MLNKATLMGWVASNPKYLDNDIPTRTSCRFRLKTNKIFTKQNGETKEYEQFHNIVIWGVNAKIAQDLIKFDDLVFIEGNIDTNIYEDDDGIEKYMTNIQSREFRIIATSDEKEKYSNAFNTDKKNDLPF